MFLSDLSIAGKTDGVNYKSHYHFQKDTVN